MTAYLFPAITSYLLGSIPFGLIASKLLRNVDIRDYGSGRTGSTNVQRTLGTPAALIVLLMDTAKSVLAVLFTRILSDNPGVEAAAALTVILGHNFPVFIGFKGGRGIAPGIGGLLVLSPISGLIALTIGLPSIALWKYVSLGSLLGGTAGVVTLSILCLTGSQPLEYIWYGLFGIILVFASHKDNIKRLVNRRERRLGQIEESVKT